MTRPEAHEPSQTLWECGSLPAVAGLFTLSGREGLPLWVRPFPYPNLNEVAAALREGCKFAR